MSLFRPAAYLIIATTFTRIPGVCLALAASQVSQQAVCGNICDGRPCEGTCADGSVRSGSCISDTTGGCRCGDLFECPTSCGIQVDAVPPVTAKSWIVLTGNSTFKGYNAVDVAITGGLRDVSFTSSPYRKFAVTVPLDGGTNHLQFDARASGPPGCHSTVAFDVAAPVQRECTGDCAADGTVTIDELLVGVNIALGSARVTTCPAFDVNNDGEVTVDELMAAVSAAIFGCDYPLPNLTVTHAELGIGGIPGACEEIRGLLHVCIINDGQADAPAFTIQAEQVTDWYRVPGLVAGQEQCITQPGYGHRIVLDPADEVAESNEADNIFEDIRYFPTPAAAGATCTPPVTPSTSSPTPTPIRTLGTNECRDSSDCVDAFCLAPGDFPGCGPTPAPVPTADQCNTDNDCQNRGEEFICAPAPPDSCRFGMACQRGCVSEADCEVAQICGVAHRCTAAPCDNDGQCPAPFRCAQSSGSCVRRRCQRDADCVAAYCVNGSCYDRPGVCTTPPE